MAGDFMNLTKRQLQEVREIRQKIGARLHFLRVQKRETLHHLSLISRISSDKIDQYELGKNEIGIEALVNLACALDIEVGEFFLTIIPS